MRTALRLLVAVALVVVGWYVGSSQAREGSFLLKVDVPPGGMTMSCERCRLLSWPEGHAQSNATLTLACADDTCPHAIGGVLVAEPPPSDGRCVAGLTMPPSRDIALHVFIARGAQRLASPCLSWTIPGARERMGKQSAKKRESLERRAVG